MTPDALWEARQAEAVAGALLRGVERLTRALGSAPLGVRDRAALAHDDARRLVGRVHQLRRAVESLTVEAGT